MSPRLKVLGTYHRNYRRLIRQAGIWPSDSDEAKNLLRDATLVYRAMVIEAHPEKAHERR